MNITFSSQWSSIVLASLLGVLVSIQSAYAKKVADVEVLNTLEVADQSLILNGAGIRKKLFIKLYVGSLYVAETGQSAEAIIDADEAMAIQLVILSDLLTPQKMLISLTKGLKKSTGGNIAPIQTEIDQLTTAMDVDIQSGDSITLAYEPEAGTHVMHNGKTMGLIPGLPFKRALFGVWLSDAPAQASLKKAMLGQ